MALGNIVGGEGRLLGTGSPDGLQGGRPLLQPFGFPVSRHVQSTEGAGSIMSYKDLAKP